MAWQKGTAAAVRQHVARTPEVVYDLVTDVTRMGEWSPECVGGQWLDGATGAAVGARFRGRNKRGLARWSNKPRVVVADRGREFAFVAPDLLGRDMTRWTYRFEPANDGTDVVESFEFLAALPLFVRLAERYMMGVRDRKADLEAGMRNTLLQMKAATENEGKAAV